MVLFGLDPAQGGNILEVILCKSLWTVNILLVESHGRRFWRRQIYASDARFSMLFLQPSWKDRRGVWPAWGRYEGGEAGLPRPAPSAVITREGTHADNLAGTEELFVPSRFLHGAVPSALLESHTFYLDDNDVMRGYPAKDEKTGIYPHVILVEISKSSKLAKVYKRPLKSIRSEWAESDHQQLKLSRETSEDETGLHNENGARKRPTLPSRTIDRGVYDDDAEMVLLDPLFAPPDSKLRRVAQCLVKIEHMSHVLFWKNARTAVDAEIDKIELPRLKITFEERGGKLYSIDHADLAICNDSFLAARPQLLKLLQGLPHALTLVNSNDEVFFLVPLDRTARPKIGASPFSTELVVDKVNWRSLATRSLLFPVHVSLSFIQTPSLLSAMTLLHLRFLNRDYIDVIRLVISVGTDTELGEEESAVLREISSIVDDHPDAHAARIHLSLALMDAPPVVRAGVTWDLPDNVFKYLNKLAHVSMSARLELEQEKLALKLVAEQIIKEDAIRKTLESYDQNEVKKLFGYLFDPAVAEEIGFQEKRRYEAMLEQVHAAIEASSDRNQDVTAVAEVKKLLPVAMSVTRSPFVRATLKNRSAWLAVAPGDSAVLITPPRTRLTNWQWWSSDAALSATLASWESTKLEYNETKSASGISVFEKLWGVSTSKPPESMLGAPLGLGFIALYEMLTGTSTVKVTKIMILAQ